MGANAPTDPIWYGRHYPTLEDLEAFAWDLGANIVYGDVPKGACLPKSPDNPPVIVVPDHSDNLPRCWSLAHELGHIVLHLGYISPWTRARQETQAERWAACALIPEARIIRYANACEDAFIGALSANYGDIPREDCRLRRLAGKIARIRLQVLPQNLVSV